MGYRYGEHKYSEGLYSRWPDWWHDKACGMDEWDVQPCAPPAWTPAVAGGQWRKVVPVEEIWTPVGQDPPHLEHWKKVSNG